MRCSSYDECDGHGLLLSDLLALPAAASARTSTCSVLNVKTVVTASINTRPQDGCWSPAHAFQMVAAAVAYLLRSVDVGAQAPTPFSVKMPSGHLVQRAAKIQKIRATFVVVVVFSQENTRLSTNCDSSAAEKKLSPTPLHYPLALPGIAKVP